MNTKKAHLIEGPNARTLKAELDAMKNRHTEEARIQIEAQQREMDSMFAKMANIAGVPELGTSDNVAIDASYADSHGLLFIVETDPTPNIAEMMAGMTGARAN